MKIISRDELMALDAGVIYCEYEQQVFGDLNIKHDTSYKTLEGSDYIYGRDNINKPRSDKSQPIDWYMHQLLELGCSDERDHKLNSNASFSLDHECIGRDGCFANDQLYAVLEVNDLVKMQILIEKAMIVSPNWSIG